jgi:hypothetical protein
VRFRSRCEPSTPEKLAEGNAVHPLRMPLYERPGAPTARTSRHSRPVSLELFNFSRSDDDGRLAEE